jgi:RND family efflux transporter MFP subunit
MSDPQHTLRTVKLLGTTALLCLAAATGCKQAQAESSSKAVPVKVDTVPAKAITVTDLLQLTGTLRGERETELAANVNGRVVQVLVERGAAVKAGELIARVDVKTAALQLAEAKVQIATTKTQQEIDQVECERYQKLKERGAVTELEYANVMARCKKAPLSLEAAEARADLVAKSVGDGLIRAPFAGVVTDRFVEVGTYVQPQTRVVALADVSSLRLEFSVPEADYPSVKVGTDLTFKVVAYHERRFQGKVTYLGGAVRATRDVIVEAKVANEQSLLLPGMFANVELPRGAVERPAVPATALFDQNGKANVFVVEGGILSQRVVQTDSAVGDQVPIRNGIAIGSQVVSVHRPDLTNGMLAQ